MCYHPLFSPPSDFFFCFATTPLRQSFCLSCFCLSFSLSEKAQCANVSTFLFICQSLEQRPAPSVYLHSAAPSAQLFSPLPFPLFQFFFSSSTSSHFLFPNSIFYCPHSDHAILSHLFIQLCCVLFIWIPPLCHLNSIFCTILASPMSLPYPSAPTPPPHPLLFMDHGTFIGVTSWHFQCWLRLVHQVFWLKSTAITPSIDSFWIYFQMRVRVCSCLTHRITKHLIPLSIILKCLFLSPFALLLIFLSPHIHLPPVVLYPSLYLSIITVMTHVAHTCSAVKGGLREGVAFHRLTDIKSLHNEGFGRVSLCIFLTPWPFFKFALWFGLEDRVQATI